MLLVAGEDCALNHVPINRCSSDAKSSQLVLARGSDVDMTVKLGFLGLSLLVQV